MAREKFSPHEILTYGPANDDGKRGKKKNATVVERAISRSCERCLKSQGCHARKDVVHISTYIDKDGFVPTQELANKTTSHRTDIPKLGRAVALLPVRGGQHSSRGSATRIRRETKCKTMHIMATVDAKEAMEKDPTAPRFFEVVLCSIKYYEDSGLWR